MNGFALSLPLVALPLPLEMFMAPLSTTCSPIWQVWWAAFVTRRQACRRRSLDCQRSCCCVFSLVIVGLVSPVAS